jgi:hypothetical protein
MNLSKVAREAPDLFDLYTCNGFSYEGTGGNCDALIAVYGDKEIPHFEVWITDIDSPSIPDNFPILIGFYKVKDYGCIGDDEKISETICNNIDEANECLMEIEGKYTCDNSLCTQTSISKPKRL